MLLDEIAAYSQDLPNRVRRVVTRFKHAESADVCVVQGLDINHNELGPTPNSWSSHNGREVAEPDVYLLLMSALLGDPFAWSTQQGGRIIHEIVPVRSDAALQISSGATAGLDWHTEDAFHRSRADYVGLLCLRNPDGVATTIGKLDLTLLSEREVQVLREKRFEFRADASHDLEGARKGVGGGGVGLCRTFEGDTTPTAASAVLFGFAPPYYIRVDPLFMVVAQDDEEAAAALAALYRAIDQNMRHLCLRPGDCCFIDNFRVVHGRTALEPRYDGTGRWLKRVNVARDLRGRFRSV